MKRYSLQSYKGIATRHTCPSCGDKRSFVYYVDEENTPLHPSVGRCNYESSCGYHYTPKQYFQDHPECRTFDASSFDGQMKRSEEQEHSDRANETYAHRLCSDSLCGEI